jgi:hypothetical protein
MASIKINSADMKQLQRKIEQLKKIDSSILGNEIGKSAFLIDQQAKKNISAAGFSHSKGGLTKGQKFNLNKAAKEVEILNDTKYSAFIEFGTRHKPIKLDDMLELGIPASYAAQFKANPLKKPTNVTAKPFFFSAVRVGFRSLLKQLDRQIKKAMK